MLTIDYVKNNCNQLNFNSIPIRIAELKPVSSVVFRGPAVRDYAGPSGAFDHACAGLRIGYFNPERNQSNRIFRRTGGPAAGPSVQAQVVMIATGGDEQRAGVAALGDFESKQVTVKRLRLAEI